MKNKPTGRTAYLANQKKGMLGTREKKFSYRTKKTPGAKVKKGSESGSGAKGFRAQGSQS